MGLNDFLASPTDWYLVNSSGAEVSVGLGDFLSVGGTLGNIYVREGDGLLINLQYFGLSQGVGVGLSLLGPIGASFSPASFPGEGVGRIYKGPTAGKRLSINDMLGPFYMWTFGLNAAPADFTVSVVLMGLPMQIGALTGPALLLAKAAGIVWGIAASSSGGIEGSATTGTILAAYSNGLQVSGN